jgi:ATP synthase protein I
MKQEQYKSEGNTFLEQIIEKEQRKIKAANQPKNNIWFGLGTMGMIGWSVVAPALVGVLAGTWLDNKYPQLFSWTLSLLIVGLISGSVIAWYWVDKEDKKIHQDKEEEDDE